MQKQEIETSLNSGIKKFLLVMFILSLLSIFGAMMLVAISVAMSPLPDFPLTMTEHMWKFYLIVPIPGVSAILGIVFIRKKYKCKKNIIAGIIMTTLLCVYGGFTSIFANRISHDSNYIIELSNEVNFYIPNDSYISIAFDFNENCESMAMIKINSSANNDFINKLEGNNNRKKDRSFIPSNVLDIYAFS